MYPQFASRGGAIRLPKRLELRRLYREWRYRRLARDAECVSNEASPLMAEGYSSQCGQDKWLVEKAFPGLRKGVFVDIGAHDGISFSNTLFLERRLGWTGLAIEPNPDVFERLARNRACIKVNGCVAGRSGTARFRKITGYSEMLSGLVDQYDSRHEQRIAREVEERGGTIEETVVECFRLNELLAKHGLRDVHYLNIDVEGAEYNILRGFDFTAASVHVWGIENNYRDYRIPLLMKRSGYDLVAIVGDEFYVRKGAVSAARQDRNGLRRGSRGREDGLVVKTSSVIWTKTKTLIRSLAPTEIRGAWDYHRHPEARDTWGGPCNGQHARQSLVREILGTIAPSSIIETGTYRGTTTAWFRDVGQVPVVTIENSRWFWGYSAYRFVTDRKVSVRRGDSRKVLASLTRNGRLAETPTFFYLDAHWNDDLPLRDELEIIFSACTRAVVMIDDFQVPDDSGYAYDDYGPTKALTLEYTRPVAERFGLDVFFPATASGEETGARRGCVVMAKRDPDGAALGTLSGLRRGR